MDKKSLTDRLLALCVDKKGKKSKQTKLTKTAQLLAVMPDIEAVQALGVSRASIVEELNACGLEISLATFDGTLRRLRKRKKMDKAPQANQLNKNIENKQATGECLDDRERLGRSMQSDYDLDAFSKILKRGES